MDRYSRLKLNTKRWVQWLCQTADEHGSPTRTTPRLNSTLSDVTTQEILRQAGFLELYSRSNGVRYTMPRSIWHAYKSAHKERVGYAARYADDDRDQLSNAGHQYFNGVMDSVQKQLRDCVDVVAVARPVAEDTESLATIFEKLNVMDPDSNDSDEDEEEEVEIFTDNRSGAPKEEQSGLEPVLSPAYERRMRTYYLRKIIEEQVFGYLRNVWIGTYQTEDALVSTAVASFLTSAALALVGQWEQNILQQPQQAGKNANVDLVLDAKDPMFVALLTLRAVAQERAKFGNGYRTGLKPLDVRQPNDNFGLNEQEHKNMVGIDTTGIQVLMELQLENEIISNIWNDVDS